ncbi:acetylglutamate kinase [Oceanimonas baumannii]|uniref:Acetylglutamate kinase n=1 Tax=Oceanimonas baumannii TaxID=129578 RepID=A0A235CIN4_9GAMM|nr:acetylglutamate kinase [Oceanimonas baumannii]OYD24393.1 acetylglutamate kinase [Oceanimonas baumannii]TDW59133.1 N-acetylglutamate kinase [Oceanimonas baumannii]
MSEQQPLVVKLGGTLLESDKALEALFSTLKAFVNDSSRPLVLVHGGGVLVDNQLKAMGLTSTKKNGLRVTPFEQIPVIAGALAGTANKLLLAQAIAHNIPSVGLCLADGGLCRVSQLDPELGAVGQIEGGDSALVSSLLSGGFMPIVSSIGVTFDGNLMNVNADQAATAIAEILDAELVMLSDVSGILDGKGQRIALLTEAEAEELMDKNIIKDGMAVKVKAALKATKTLGRPVAVGSWRYPEQLLSLLAGESEHGTRISH